MEQNNRIVFYPWSERLTNLHMEEYRKNKIPVLDIDLSTTCKLGTCVYCDSKINSPDPDELTFDEIEDVILQCKKLGLKSVYVCGIGEPTDHARFMDLVELLHKEDITLSMFTNGHFEKEEVKILRKCNVSLILKLDTFKAETFSKILGKPGSAEKIYNTLESLLEVGYAQKGDTNETDLAFSIVPTKWSYNDVPEVIEFCKKNFIFPSIGELEYSGRAKGIYDDYSLSREELLDLKRQVEDILGYPYQRPICPAIISGMHLTNTGKCVVHRDTGLSCHWFLLTEPNMVEIGDVRKDSLEELNDKLREYRKQNALVNLLKIESKIPNVFGGCGGKLEEILRIYSTL